MNEITANTLLQGEGYAQSQIQNALAIAHQCPYAGGNAVYLARAFVEKYYSETECANCGLLGQMCLTWDGVTTCLNKFYNSTDTIIFLNCTNSPVNIPEVKSESDLIKIFPNPCYTKLFFNSRLNKVFFENFTDDVNINIYNILGKCIKTYTVSVNELNSYAIDVKFLKAGMYPMLIQHSTFIISIKLIKL
ncbi:MAG: T9SS type A sorting domain-containing protein [Bacteroidetes bacterium]|jgi:hypothetical protein|nr:T9SS type A sorting domain-containing protein [Bacteroidota bacterium]